MEELYSVSEFADKVNLHKQTIKRYCRNNDIKYTRTPGGHRRIPESELEQFSTNTTKENTQAILYSRVSSHDQKDDLQTQQKTLENHAKENNYEIVNTYSDIGSGLNEKRREFNKLLDVAEKTNATILLITYEDRLTRFGYSYLERYFNTHDITIKPVFEQEEKNTEEELVDDLISLVSSFSGRLYGMRSNKQQEAVKAIKNILLI